MPPPVFFHQQWQWSIHFHQNIRLSWNFDAYSPRVEINDSILPERALTLHNVCLHSAVHAIVKVWETTAVTFITHIKFVTTADCFICSYFEFDCSFLIVDVNMDSAIYLVALLLLPGNAPFVDFYYALKDPKS